MQTQIALALNGRDRDEALSVIAGLLAEHSRTIGHQGMNPLFETIKADEPALRDRSFRCIVEALGPAELPRACDELEAFRRSTDNLYHRVRATLFLYAVHRFAEPGAGVPATGLIPPQGAADLLERRFEQAMQCFLAEATADRAQPAPAQRARRGLPSPRVPDACSTRCAAACAPAAATSGCSAWATPTTTLCGSRPKCSSRSEGTLLYPILAEATPVRLDLSHSGWSDIFFLGMDYPEGARVLNISVDLGVHGRDTDARPPIEAFVRVHARTAAAAHQRRPRGDQGRHGSARPLQLRQRLPRPGEGGRDRLGAHSAWHSREPASPWRDCLRASPGGAWASSLSRKVNDIPKGSRLAVSTNLLASHCQRADARHRPDRIRWRAA